VDDDSQQRGARAAELTDLHKEVNREISGDRKEVNTKDLGPDIHEARPKFWTEYVLFLAGGYLAGMLSIMTCEYTGIRIAVTSGVTVAILGTAVAIKRKQG